MSNFIFLLLICWTGLQDLRHRRLKHWQVFILAQSGLVNLLWQHSLSLHAAYTTLGVLILGWLGYIVGRWGAADVKVIAITSLSLNLYHYSSWWVWQALLLTAFIDGCLWGFYFRHRKEDSPLLLAWAIAVVGVYLYYR